MKVKSLFLVLFVALLGLVAAVIRPVPEKRRTGSAGADSARLKKALESFRLEEGLKIELVASEPTVVDPVAFAFDEQNNLYVAEDRGYPDPIDGSEAPAIGRIALLRDKDGDGRFETRTDFVTGLTYPNGILPWKGGVFVTCAPHIYYFKDTDGDGVADVKDIVLTGFNSDKTAQIRVSHPTLGLDGWIYVTSGLNSGKITSPKHPERPAVAFTSADGRFHPGTFEFQSTGGRSQFGLAFDPFGHRFGTSNRHPVMQMMLEPWYLKRNPSLLFTETHQNVSAVEAQAVVFPISGAVTTAEYIPKLMGLSHTGTFTSACGLVIYNGDGLGDGHQGNVFICEPAQNLVQRQVMKTNGVGYASSLPYTGKEFLASTDSWFRPVFLQHGPDGALYVADMYRKTIDHPSYVPKESRHLLDFESGKTDGRLYRILKAGIKTSSWNASVFASLQETLKALDSNNEWMRETAFRKLLEGADGASVPALKKQLQASAYPETRAKALWLLKHLGAVDDEVLGIAFRDPVAGVREQAVRIAESSEPRPAFAAMLVKGAADPDMRVRYASALALGGIKDAAAIKALAALAAKDGDDKWVRNAVLSGISGHLPAFLTAFQAQKGATPGAYAAVMQDLGRLFGNAASVADCKKLLFENLDSKGAFDWRTATLLGLAEGVSRRTEFQGKAHSPLRLLAGGEGNAAGVKKLDGFMNTVKQRALNARLRTEERRDAVALLGFYDFNAIGAALQKTLGAHNPPEVQIETVTALTRLGKPEGAAYMTKPQTWSAYTPRVKNAVVAALVSNPAYIAVLFKGLEDKVIKASEIASNDRQRLIQYKDPEISKKASAYFDELESGGRMKVYQDFRAKLSKPAVSAEGKAVFQRSCSACHTYAGLEGGNVGPDLTGVRNQPADALLLHIIVPNYEVYPAYQALNIETNDGNTVTGWLVSETDNSLTIRTAFSTEESILRKNVKSLTNPGVTLMPDGLEQTMTEQELLNLIAFLKAGK